MQFSARFVSTIHDFLTGTSWLIKGRTINPSLHRLQVGFTGSVGWGAGHILEKKNPACSVPCMTDKITGYPVISFLKHFWLLVQDVPKGTTLLSHHYGDSFLHLPSVEASARTPRSFTSPQKASLCSLMPTVHRCCAVLPGCYLAPVCWTTCMKVAFTCQSISI